MKKILLTLGFLIFLVGCDASTIKPYLNPSMDTITEGDTYIDQGAYVLVGFTRYMMSTQDQIDSSLLGLQSIEYTLTYEDIMYNITRYVMVIESTSISVNIRAGIDTIEVGDTWTDAGLDTDLDITYEVIGEVDTTQVGTYVIEYIITYQDQLYKRIRYVSVV